MVAKQIVTSQNLAVTSETAMHAAQQLDVVYMYNKGIFFSDFFFQKWGSDGCPDVPGSYSGWTIFRNAGSCSLLCLGSIQTLECVHFSMKVQGCPLVAE